MNSDPCGRLFMVRPTTVPAASNGNGSGNKERRALSTLNTGWPRVTVCARRNTGNQKKKPAALIG
ncbi:MAG: hypothetical protein OEW36_05300 [Hylemonella sp.]|nr:hypothetical protein [Hylemonella sp.]